MKKWNLCDETTLPDGQKLGLWEHDGSYSLRISGKELMNTRQHSSEQHLAEICCKDFAAAKAPRVLIGGLGFGFTLRTALSKLPSDAIVHVAELLPDVVRWNRDPQYPLAHDVLSDPRAYVIEGDVVDVIQNARGQSYDAIILDVDNGAAAFTQTQNDRLYREGFLMQILSCLTSRGLVGFWSAQADPKFAKTLSKAGFRVETDRARAHDSGGSWHNLILGYVS